ALVGRIGPRDTLGEIAGVVQHEVATAYSDANAGDGGTQLFARQMLDRPLATTDGALALKHDLLSDRIAEARIKGYEGEACGSCGNFTLVRNGTCMKCNTCGGTSGCS